MLAGFENFSLPLNVLEMDKNWHTGTDDLSRGCQGFNGYDWDPALFPDPVGFVATARQFRRHFFNTVSYVFLCAMPPTYTP